MKLQTLITASLGLAAFVFAAGAKTLKVFIRVVPVPGPLFQVKELKTFWFSRGSEDQAKT